MRNSSTLFITIISIVALKNCFAVGPIPSSKYPIKKIYFADRSHPSYNSKFSDHKIQIAGTHKQSKSPLALKNSIETSVNNAYEIYIINLERRKDRWDTISKSLDAQNISYTRVDAMDGKQVFASDQDMIDQGFVEEGAFKKKALTRGAVALGLTGRNVWQMCKDSEKDFCVVLEDDILLDSNFKNNLYQLLGYIREYPFDILMLHQNTYGFWRGKGNEKNIYNAEWVERDNPKKIIRSIMGFSGAAYIINGSPSAQKLLRGYTLPLDCAIDMFWWGTYKDNEKKLPFPYRKFFTEKPEANNINVMQTHPLWYKNLCATSSQCTDGNPGVKDSEILSR